MVKLCYPLRSSNHDEKGVSMSHQQLVQEQRYKIYALKKTGVRDTAISNILHAHKSTVCCRLKMWFT